ncbi:MAG TPA: hypothetical protein VHX88_04580 [Solirubrobacteraceae bacterium]|jgi:hypothetical protein|nr:hypothetical protein [Solirubrobacteraceae bacterium]
MPQFALLVLTEGVAGREQEYNDWYTGQHLGDILEIEGYNAAQRFEFVEGTLSSPAPQRYLAVYELEADSVEQAEERLKAKLAVASRSDAVSPERTIWWVRPVTERRTAG